MLSTLIIGTMTLKPIATKADSKVELTAGVTSYLSSVMLGKIEPTVVQNEPVVVEQPMKSQQFRLATRNTVVANLRSWGESDMAITLIRGTRRECYLEVV